MALALSGDADRRSHGPSGPPPTAAVAADAAATTRGLRVLQVLGTTDADDDGLAAIDLHRALARCGLELRTVALGPGRLGGLDALVATMSPSARSPAARAQLRRERRWADVVVLRGALAVSAASPRLRRRSGADRRGAVPQVLYLAGDVGSWRGSTVPGGVRRLLGQGAPVVVSHPEDVAPLVALGAEPAEVVVIHSGIDVSGSSGDPAARRAAARAALGLPLDAVVVHVEGRGRRVAEVADRVRSSGAVLLADGAVDAGRPEPDRRVRFGAEPPRRGSAVGSRGESDEHGFELRVAAADLVVVPDPDATGPSQRLLRGAAGGRALVAFGGADRTGLVDDATGWDDLDAALRSDREEMHRRGLAAAARAVERFDLREVAALWSELLRSTAGWVVPP